MKTKKSRIKPVWDSGEENENSLDNSKNEEFSLNHTTNDEDNRIFHSTKSKERKKKKLIDSDDNNLSNNFFVPTEM